MFKVAVSLLVYAVVLVFCAHLPSEFETCKLSDNTCLKEKVQNAVSKLGNGIKDLKIRGMDPLKYKSVTVEPVPGPISLSQKYSNVVVTGFSKTQVSKFTLDLNKCKMEAEVSTPNLKVTGHYVFKGQLLVFPIDAEGDFVIEHEGFRTNTNATCEKFQKDGKDYLRFLEFSTRLGFGTAHFQMGEFVKGKPQINEDIHKVLNDDPAAFLETLRGSIEGMWNDYCLNTANQLFTQVPLAEVFQDYSS